MTGTKKLPIRVNEKKRTTFRNEFLLPQLSLVNGPGFVSIKSGKLIQTGSIVFVGLEVTAQMLLDKFCEHNPAPHDKIEALRRLEAFVEALGDFKIGNVISISYTASSLPVLELKEECFLSKPNLKLP